jgi:hypothetical protein
MLFNILFIFPNFESELNLTVISLSSERLVDIKITKFYVEKVVLSAKFEVYPSSSNIFALKLWSNECILVHFVVLGYKPTI